MTKKISRARGPNLCPAIYFYIVAEIWKLSQNPLPEREGQQSSAAPVTGSNPSTYTYLHTFLISCWLLKIIFYLLPSKTLLSFEKKFRKENIWFCIAGFPFSEFFWKSRSRRIADFLASCRSHICGVTAHK